MTIVVAAVATAITQLSAITSAISSTISATLSLFFLIVANVHRREAPTRCSMVEFAEVFAFAV